MNYVFLYRGWQSLAGLISVLFVTYFLSAEQQGWYYSFQSIAAIYTLFDSGLSLVLIQVFSFYKAENNLPFISKIFKRAVHKYVILSALFLIVVSVSGLLFFDMQSNAQVSPDHWQLIWLGLVIFTSINMLFMPVLAYYEGSGFLHKVYQFRILQSVVGSILLWVTLFNKGGIVAVLANPLVVVISTCIFIYLAKNKLSHIWQLRTDSVHLDWKAEVGDHQLKLAVTLISGFLLTQIYTPFVFNQFGPVAAGQFGLTLTIVNMIGLVTQSFISNKVPQMSSLAASLSHQHLMSIFKSAFLKMLLFYISGTIIFMLIKQYFGSFEVFNRLLPNSLVMLMMLGGLANQVLIAFAAHVRSYRREPFMWVNVISVVFTMILSVTLSGFFNINGVVWAIVSVQILFSLPVGYFIWRKGIVHE